MMARGGRGMPFAHHFAPDDLAQALAAQNNLVDEYKLLELSSTYDLVTTYSLDQIYSKILESINKRDPHPIRLIVGCFLYD